MPNSYGGGAPALQTITEPRKRRKPKNIRATRPRYGDRQKVKGGTLQRSRERLSRTGPVRGVNADDGITGREARRIKRADRRTPQNGGNRPRTPARRRRLSPLDREVRAEINALYGPQEEQLDYQRRQEAQFSANTGSYYQQHQQDVLQATREQNIANQAFQAGAYQAAQGAATADTQQNQQLLAQQQADAAKRGTTVDPSVAGTLQAGVAARQVAGNAGGNLIGAQGQAQGGYMANQVTAAGEQGLQAQSDQQNRERRLSQLAEDLQARKGQDTVRLRRERQDTAHKQRLEEAAFGLDVQQERFDQQSSLRDDRRQGRDSKSLRRDRILDNRRQAAKDRRDTAKDRYQREHGLGPYKPPSSGDGADGKPKYTQSQRNSNQSSYRKARSLSAGIQGKPAQIISFLVNKKGIDPLIARAAAAPGTLTARQRAELKRMGVRFPKGHPGTKTPRNPDGTPG